MRYFKNEEFAKKNINSTTIERTITSFGAHAFAVSSKSQRGKHIVWMSSHVTARGKQALLCTCDSSMHACIPCRHAHIVLKYGKLSPSAFVDPSLLVTSGVAIYEAAKGKDDKRPYMCHIGLSEIRKLSP